MCVITKDHSFP